MNRKNKKPRFNLRLRLTLLVTAEVLASLLFAWGTSELLNFLFPNLAAKIPLYAEIGVFALLVGILATVFLSNVFFKPIRRLQAAMRAVADGDFTVRLEVHSSSAEIRELYEHFNQMVQELGATEVLQSDFVTAVSHEFKTPINAIEGYSTLLSGNESLDKEAQLYVHKILSGTARLSELVRGILLISKVENQTIDSSKSHFRLDEQIRVCLVSAENEWTKKNLDLDVDLCLANYFGTEHLLCHVWDNLISNAIKFNREGGLLRLRLTEDGTFYRFTIEDEGCGLPTDKMHHIFDKFFQADSSHKESGNGLGLALVKRICALCRLQISAENRPEGGARFTVLLPRV